jgi:hypothetical protein
MFNHLDKKKLAKMQLLQDPSQYSGNKLKNVEKMGYVFAHNVTLWRIHIMSMSPRPSLL